MSPGTDVMILKIFSPKNWRNFFYVFRLRTKLNYEKMIITLVFEKNAKFFAENWRKSHKIVIITSTPGFESFFKKNIWQLNCRTKKRRDPNGCGWIFRNILLLTWIFKFRFVFKFFVLDSFVLAQSTIFSHGTDQQVTQESSKSRSRSQAGWPDWANFHLLGDCLL
jgi:hypothetical protein